jgi:hypothetical protein
VGAKLQLGKMNVAAGSARFAQSKALHQEGFPSRSLGTRRRRLMDLRDRLFVETDDSCAICGIRGMNVLTEHHIDGNPSNNMYDNRLVLCHNCHHAYHAQKGLTDQQILDRKRHLIQKTITTYGLNAMKIAARNNFGVIAMPFLLYHIVDMGYMTKEENQMGYGEQNDATSRFSITETGRTLLSKWFR